METKQEEIVEETEMSSAYNEAGLQIQRLHNLWLNAETASIHRNYIKWNSILDAIERELFPDIEKRENKDHTLKRLLELKTEYFSGFKHIKIGSMGIKLKGSNISPCMLSLDKRHKLLKNIQDKAGKGGIYRNKNNEDFVD